MVKPTIQFSTLRGTIRTRRKIPLRTTRALFEKYLCSKEANFTKGQDFEEVAKELNL